MAPSATPRKMVGLPLIITSPVDLSRLLRELEAVDAAMLQANLTGADAKLPKLTLFMDQTVELNKLDLSSADERQALKIFLVSIHDRAPRLHVSFGVDPSEQFISKFMLWIRQSLHPLALLTIGLQPGIGAGCMVRTTNKYFDFSLASKLSKQRVLLMKRLQDQPAPTVSNSEVVVEATT